MSKTKKQPQMTLKERRAEKRAKVADSVEGLRKRKGA